MIYGVKSQDRAWHFLDRVLHFEKPIVMGILNVTPDSFSDGGEFYSIDKAASHAHQMLANGATIIDVGGESTRPGSQSVSVEEEIRRVIPMVKELSANHTCLISVDTQKAEVAQLAIDSGAHIINDISAGTTDKKMLSVISSTGAGFIMMHMQGLPQTMQDNPHYGNVLTEINTFFTSRLETAQRAGILESQIVLDPGIGFGKRLDHNLNIMNNMGAFHIHGRPVLLGASRKSFINLITPSAAADRLGGSIAAVLASALTDVEIFRVHDVPETLQALDIFTAIRNHSV